MSNQSRRSNPEFRNGFEYDAVFLRKINLERAGLLLRPHAVPLLVKQTPEQPHVALTATDTQAAGNDVISLNEVYTDDEAAARLRYIERIRNEIEDLAA